MADTRLRRAPMHPGMFMWYLSRFCGQRDAVQFFDAAGQPDLLAARAYAEELRARLAHAQQSVLNCIRIEQRNHEVVITSTLVVPPQGDKPWYDGARLDMLKAFAPAAPAQQQQVRSGRGSRGLAPA